MELEFYRMENDKILKEKKKTQTSCGIHFIKEVTTVFGTFIIN